MKIHPYVERLLAEIDAYRARTGLNATQFGIQSVNDGGLLRDLQNGRTPSLSTIDRVRDFMKTGAEHASNH